MVVTVVVVGVVVMAAAAAAAAAVAAMVVVVALVVAVVGSYFEIDSLIFEIDPRDGQGEPAGFTTARHWEVR